ncbi:MAG: hypothetical protein A2638_05945 [Nitrospirae bacterium RIFCSPHIGHO2_01_FULL_66_17]|nr:MAG: hypothetical protein A2638_05945 [Nitrospirae bacterium RIFCSPHIGHO2_01_FULL_66_17]
MLDESSDFLRAFREAFWELADRAERTRARLRVRREQAALARREAVICGQLGRMGFALMEDGVSLIRTPEVAALIEDIGRLAADQQQKERRLAGELSEMAGFDWRRLSQQFEAGECVLTQICVAPDAPGCGRSLTTNTPAGLCVAVKRGDELRQVSGGLTCRPDDILFVATPTSAVPQWESWAGGTSTTSVD